MKHLTSVSFIMNSKLKINGLKKLDMSIKASEKAVDF